MESFKFKCNLILLERILSHTQFLSLELQNESENIINASNLIKCTEKQLGSFREDLNFNEIYSKAEKFAEELHIEVSHL